MGHVPPQPPPMVPTPMPSHFIVDIEEGEVVPSRPEEVSPCIVSKHGPVLGTVENGVIDGEHGRYGQDLLATLVPAGNRENFQIDNLAWLAMPHPLREREDGSGDHVCLCVCTYVRIQWTPSNLATSQVS